MSISNAIATILPPPEYLLLPSVGIDISDTSLKYTTFVQSQNGHNLLLSLFGDIDIEAGTLSRGNVKEKENLIAALKEVKKRTNSEYVRLSLPEERAYLFETQIKKGTASDEIQGFLEFRLEENVPISPRDAYFDYDIYTLSSTTDMLGVSVTAYTCDTINGYYEACQKAGLIPIAFEVEAQAIARSILPKNIKGTHMIIDFGKMRTGIGIVHDGVLMYTSTIDIGGKHMSEALRQKLGNKKEDELTEIKNSYGLVSDEKKPEIYEALSGVALKIKNEIAQRIQYWNNRNDTIKDRFIEQILLCGGSSNLNGLPEYLSDVLDIETKRANVWQNAFDVKKVIPPIDQRHAYGYATAIGLGLATFM